MTGGVVLAARLAVPEGHLDVAGGSIEVLPDHPAHVAALLGTDGRRDHRIRLAGRRLDRLAPAGRVRAGLAAVTTPDVAPDVSVLAHVAAVEGRRSAHARLARAPLLAGRGAEPAGLLSGGERRVLGWLVADATQPQAVVLDRAATGLDRDSFAWAHRVLDAWLDRGVAVVVRVGRDEEQAWLPRRADGLPRGLDA